jgi:hypothetical protein
VVPCVSRYPPIPMLSSLATMARVSDELVWCSASVPTSRREMFASKDRPKSM